MQKLEPQDQVNITQEIVAHILGAYAVSNFTFQFISEGIANTSLAVESAEKKYVLRIYAQKRKSDENIAFEVAFQDYLRTHGIPIPVIYENTEGKELTIIEAGGKRWQIVLMQFVEGQSVTPHPSQELIAKLAHLQARMHLLGVDFAKSTNRPKHLWVDLHDSLAQKIKNVSIKSKEVLDFIERVKSYSYPLNPHLPYGYNHLDIDFDGNVLTQNNRINGIIDFDDLEYSPPIVCLGFSLWNVLDDAGIDSMRQYLKEYEKVRPLTSAEYETLPHVIFFRNYVLGIVRLLLWDETTPIADIENILKLEKEIPALTF